jgi:hypothetical protein
VVGACAEAQALYGAAHETGASCVQVEKVRTSATPISALLLTPPNSAKRCHWRCLAALTRARTLAERSPSSALVSLSKSTHRTDRCMSMRSRIGPDSRLWCWLPAHARRHSAACAYAAVDGPRFSRLIATSTNSQPGVSKLA